MGQEASFQQQGKITFAREKAQKGTEKKAMRNDHKQAEINRDDNNAATALFDVPARPGAEGRVFHDSPHDDWLVLPTWNRLHRIHTIAWEGGDPEIECYGDGVAVCGAAGLFRIPGFMSRMGLARCAHCCDQLGIPRGSGNTLNAGIKEPT